MNNASIYFCQMKVSASAILPDPSSSSTWILNSDACEEHGDAESVEKMDWLGLYF
jgi:hypothetical protein